MNRKRLSVSMSLAGLLLLFAAPLVGTAAATHVSCGDTVTTNITLDADVGPCAGNGLIVGADNITIDLNGHRLFGTDGVVDEGGGIIIDRHSGVTVKNGTIERFDAGVAIDGVFGVASGNTVTGITAQHNFPTTLTAGDYGDGIAIFGPGADNNTVSNSTIRNNGPYSGISVFGGSSADKVTGTVITGNTIVDNNSRSSQTGGLRLENWTWDAIVSDNVISGSALEGIALFADTQNVDVLNNAVSGNGFTSSTATHRKGDGIRAFARTSFHLIQDNKVTGNAGNGIRLDGPSGSSPGANNHEVLMNKSTGNNLSDDPPSVPPKHTPHHHDLSDGNTTPPCDNNFWSGNSYGTANQSCTTL